MRTCLFAVGIVFGTCCRLASAQDNPTSRPVSKAIPARPRPAVPQGIAKPETNYALKFGPGAGIKLDMLYNGGEITVEAWVRPDKATLREKHLSPIIGNLQQKRGIGLGITQGHWIMRAWTNGGDDSQAMSADPVVLGKTVHIAGVLQGTQIRLYVDGKLQDIHKTKEIPTGRPGKHAKGKSPGEFRASNLPFYIGTDPTGSGKADSMRVFHGIIDEVRLSNGARYRANFQPERSFKPDSRTFGMFHFDEGSGDTTVDAADRKKPPVTIDKPEWIPFEIPEPSK